MSIKIMSRVWETPCESHTQKLVLLALADNSNDEGKCWPSVVTLAKKCDLSERSIFEQLRRLNAMGVVSVQSGGGNTSNHYTLNLPDPCTPFRGERGSGVNRVQGSPAHGSGVPLNAVQGTPARRSGEPSENRQRTVKEPSLTPKSSGARKPLNLDEVIVKGGMIGVSEEDCRNWYRDCEACEWKRGDGTPFDNWPRQLVIHRDTLAERRAKLGKANGSRPASIHEISTVIKIKQEKAHQIKEKYSTDGPLSRDWSNDTARQEYIDLCKEIKQLKTKAEGMV